MLCLYYLYTVTKIPSVAHVTPVESEISGFGPGSYATITTRSSEIHRDGKSKSCYKILNALGILAEKLSNY
jgi:hypothetical protein